MSLPLGKHPAVNDLIASVGGSFENEQEVHILPGVGMRDDSRGDGLTGLSTANDLVHIHVEIDPAMSENVVRVWDVREALMGYPAN